MEREDGADELERVDGIEPTSSAWKAAALPLCYTRAKNAAAPGGPAPDSVPASWSVFRKRVVGEVGLEPTKLTQGIYSPPPLPLGTFPLARVGTDDACRELAFQNKRPPIAAPLI